MGNGGSGQHCAAGRPAPAVLIRLNRPERLNALNVETLHALHDAAACALPAVAITPVGAPATVFAEIDMEFGSEGVIALEALDAKPVPTPFVAVTVKV